MPETTVGVSGYIHGLTGLTEFTGAASQSISRTTNDKLVSEVLDANGRTVTVRTDDQLDAITVTMRILASGFTRLAIGAVFTIVGGAHAGEYRVTSVTENHTNNGFAEYTVSAEKNEYIDLTP